MSSQEFQSTHAHISELSNRLLAFLQKYRQERLSEGDDTKNLKQIEQKINLVIENLYQQQYEVAVVAPMKAGKSTFLNAVIGADILASESAACTICRTDVRHITSEETPQLLEYHTNNRKPKTIAQGNAHDIQESFLKRTRELRDISDNQNLPARFELLYPIEAIQDFPALAGFTLIDTPGPNEWKSMSVDTVALKQVSLEALRTCKAVLFILNYRSFKDKAVDELFQSITENRQELLANNQSRIFFILNQVDLKSEKDPEISETISLLKQDLIRFGFPNPIIYPVSALQGLLAKLIQQNMATEDQIKDFKKFFSARYARENEEGDMITPAPKKIAHQAVQDSGIIAVQEAVFQTVVQTSGWILLDDALNLLESAAKSVEDTLNMEIVGWEMEINALKTKVEDYRHRSQIAKRKVDSVRSSIDRQKEFLLEGFSAGIDAFTEGAKEKIQNEIDVIAESRKTQKKKKNSELDQDKLLEDYSNGWKQLFDLGRELASGVLELVPVLGKTLAKTFKVSVSLIEQMNKSVPKVITEYSVEKSSNPYIMRCSSQADAQKMKEVINDFCAPHIQSWWLDTQDKLIREGTRIREELVSVIQEDIQTISDELSSYLGDSLKVEININAIQFPSFDFKGIDAQVRYQQIVYERSKKKSKTDNRGCCGSSRTYDVDVPYKEIKSFYEIDLRDTARLVKAKLDEQANINKGLLFRVIDKQVNEDFKNAENQILNYIEKFQTEFDKLLAKREKHEEEAPRVIALLKRYSDDLKTYQHEIESVEEALKGWEPAQNVN